MTERHITLIRHGKHDRTNQTIGGGDLLPEGIQQAKLVADALLDQYPISAIYSSTLRRALTTARVIATHHKTRLIKKTNFLCEAVFHVPAAVSGSVNQYQDLSPEAVTAHRFRVEAAYKRFIRPAYRGYNEHDVLVCHGNIIRYFVVRAMNAPLDLWTQMDIHNASITRIVIKNSGEVKLITHNEIGHLPRELWTLI